MLMPEPPLLRLEAAMEARMPTVRLLRLVAPLALVLVTRIAVVQAAQVSGTVTAVGIGAIADTEVAFLAAGTSSVVDTDVTDASGAYAVTVPDGTYDVRVEPPASSGFNPQTLPGRTVQGDGLLDIVLVSSSTATYAGTVTLDGAGVANQSVQLRDQSGFMVLASDQTDATGAFSMTAVPGTYTRFVSGGATAAAPTLPPSFSLRATDTLALAGTVTENFELGATRELRGTVVDADGTPVPNVSVSMSLNVAAFGSFASGTQFGSRQTDASGHFSFRAYPGSGSLSAVPQPGGAVGSATASVTVTNDTDVTIELPSTATYSGTVTLDGAGVANQSVQLRDQSGFMVLASDQTDATGAFSMTAVPGTYTRFVSGGATAAAPTLPPSFSLRATDTLALAGTVTENFELGATRELRGTVVDADGTPVPNVSVSMSLNVAAFGSFASGTQFGSRQTDASGHFSFRAYPGSGSLSAVPQPGGAVGSATASVTVTNDTDVTIELPSTATYSGTVTLDGAGVANQSVQLRDQSGFMVLASDQTDATGAFSMTAVPGTYTRFVSGGATAAAPTLPPSFSLRATDTLALAGTVTENFELGATRELRGTVVDADGTPVPNVSVSMSLNVAAFGSFASGTQFGSRQTDASGDFSSHLYPGSGNLSVSAPSGSGLVNFSIPSIVIGDSDREIGILLQFTSESVSTAVGAGGTVTTDTEGDGATPADPVETSVTTPVAGTISITESPVALVPPSGFRFLTQQVNISAPVASRGSPLRITFTLDASRVPPGQDETTLLVFKNAALVADCVGATGVADPDPCLSLRERLPDGDVRLTVLSSTASPWNLGMNLAECDKATDCDDQVSCTIDDCVEDHCVHDPDDTTCDDGAPCNGAETCNVETGCQAGAPVICSDDGNPCTDDVCDPATGECGIPNMAACDDADPCTMNERCENGVCGAGTTLECDDDGDPCTNDVCNPASGTCGIPIDGATCDDGNACTSDDRCRAGICVGNTADGEQGDFAAAACELQGLLATPPCTAGELDPRIEARFEARVQGALDHVRKAAMAISPARMRGGLNAADRQLEHLEKQMQRAKASRISEACRAEILATVMHARMTVQNLDAGR